MPRHCGNIGHDVVDKATKSEPETYIPLVTPTSLREYIRQIIVLSWETDRSHSTGKLRELKRIHATEPTPSTRHVTPKLPSTGFFSTTQDSLTTSFSVANLHQAAPVAPKSSSSNTSSVQHNSYNRNPQIDYLYSSTIYPK